MSLLLFCCGVGGVNEAGGGVKGGDGAGSPGAGAIPGGLVTSCGGGCGALAAWVLSSSWWT